MNSIGTPQQFSSTAKCILHPTDFSPESQLALAHALRLALRNQAELVIMHVGSVDDSEHFPSVRAMLERWELLPKGSHRGQVRKLGINVEKIEARGPSFAGAITNFLNHRGVDLMVIATQGRSGPAAWFHPSKAEEAARNIDIPTLFVPSGTTGCVDLEDGAVSMQQVVVPVDKKPSSNEAVERGLLALRGFGKEGAQLTLLHVGQESEFPELQIEPAGMNVQRVCRSGNPAAEIVAEAQAAKADLLIMTTEGRHGVFDVLRGTTTERVLHASPCPLLAIPANPYLV